MPTLIVKTTDIEHLQIKKDAHEHEMTVSEYVRFLIAKERNAKSKPIIKCENCKHFRDGVCFNDQWWNDDFCVSVNGNDFCSFAEAIE